MIIYMSQTHRKSRKTTRQFDSDKAKSILILVLILTGVGIGIGVGVYAADIYYNTPIEGKIQERGRDFMGYYFTIGEDQYFCTKDQYDSICVGSVVSFKPAYFVNVREFTVISADC